MLLKRNLATARHALVQMGENISRDTMGGLEPQRLQQYREITRAVHIW